MRRGTADEPLVRRKRGLSRTSRVRGVGLGAAWAAWAGSVGGVGGVGGVGARARGAPCSSSIVMPVSPVIAEPMNIFFSSTIEISPEWSLSMTLNMSFSSECWSSLSVYWIGGT